MQLRRPSKNEYYLRIAESVARRGTCLRRNYGAVIVNNDQIVGTGYTGAPRGMINCSELKCIREELGIESGKNYELCRSVHAEMNAVINAGRDKCFGGILYLAGFHVLTTMPTFDLPCSMCRRVILNAGIEAVCYLEKVDGQVGSITMVDKEYIIRTEEEAIWQLTMGQK